MNKFKAVKTKNAITYPKGYKASGIYCGIKKSGRKDLALVFSENNAVAAAVFTTNSFKAAPVLVSMKQIKNKTTRAIICNSGNANCATGILGLKNAQEMVNLTARLLKIKPSQVLVASTGGIGHQLPMKKIKSGIKTLSSKISKEKGSEAAKAILTTDTKEKQIATFNGKYKIGGITKGSGMIFPNMKSATMLAFITTDASISKNLLQKILERVSAKTFNYISVDACQSTNDMVSVISNSASGFKIKSRKDILEFEKNLCFVCECLAQKIVEDGEGATKTFEVEVIGAKNNSQAFLVAQNVTNSPLAKAAIYGADHHLIGRILSQTGQVYRVNSKRVDVFLDGKKVVSSGKIILPASDIEKLLKKKRIKIKINLKDGKGIGKFLGCDLSPRYVQINAGYKT